MRMLPAAAIPVGARVNAPVNDEVVSDVHTIVIKEVLNATPRPGRIVWICTDGMEYQVGGNLRVEVLSLPS